MARKMSLVSAMSNLIARQQTQSLNPVDTGRGWLNIMDWPRGNWQADGAPINYDKTMANWAVYACLSLIASDIAKIKLRLVEEDDDGIWYPTFSAAFSPVLRKPNDYQTFQQFIEAWVISKLGPAGNTYVLKEFDKRGLVTAMHVLDPQCVTPHVSPNGSVFYYVQKDDLTQIPESTYIPADWVIHDRAACLFHKLVGISPLYASALAAKQSTSIQENQEKFFKNMSRPSGLLTAPAQISDVTAARLKAHWEDNYSGSKLGKVAVLGDGLKYEALTSITAADSQAIEQLGYTATMICSTYHVPPFKIGIGTLPQGQKVSEMNQIYYADCLQAQMMAIQNLLDEGLYMTQLSARRLGTEFNIDDLLLMDQGSLSKVVGDKVKVGIMKIDEARKRFNLPKVVGGDTPYMQQQNYSLAALAKRDAREDPFAKGGNKQRAPKQPDDDDDTQSRTVRTPVLKNQSDDPTESVQELLERIRKGFE